MPVNTTFQEDAPVPGSWSEAQRILCVRLDTLGDVLMTGPAIRALKESGPLLTDLLHSPAPSPPRQALFPRRHMTLLTSSAGAAAGRLIPEIDDIIVYDAPWMKATTVRRTSRPEIDMAARLRQGAFDAAVVCTVYSQNPLPAAFLCYLADIPLRLAYCRENPYQLLTDWVRETEPDTCLRHEVRRQLDLVATVGARTEDERLSIRIPDRAVAAVDALLGEFVQTERMWIVIHPGATAASRRYPPESFAVVARRLVQDMGCRVVFTGTEPERDLIEQIRAWMGVPSHSLVGRLDLVEFAALLARAPLLISNNTGAVHVAAAVGTPVVDVYALTNPQHTPWQVPHRVLFHDVPCKYCYKSVCPEGHHACLRLVPPDAVVQAAAELLEEATGLKTMGGYRLVHPGH